MQKYVEDKIPRVLHNKYVNLHHTVKCNKQILNGRNFATKGFRLVII